MGITRWGRRNAAVSATVTTKKDPTAADLIPRLKIMRDVWSRLTPTIQNDPTVYYTASYGSRFRNDRMPKRGLRGKKQFGDAFGGGYRGRIKVKPTNRRFGLEGSRPYMPGLSDKWVDGDLIDALESWWLEGDPDGDGS